MATQQPQLDVPSVEVSVETHGEVNVDLHHFSDPSSHSESDKPPKIDYGKKMESQRKAWFENAIKDKLKIPNSYEEVSVLIVRWHPDIDDYRTGHDNEIRKLKRVFKRFGFSISPVVCLNTDHAKPQNTLNSAIARHIEEHDGANKLMIIYYTGHGLQLGPEGRLAFAAKTDSHKVLKGKYHAIAYWDVAEDLLLKRDVEPDVLTILDCCFASRGHKGCDDSRRIYDLLAACDRDEYTPAPCPTSFTERLVSTLDKFLEDPDDQCILTTKLLEEMNKTSESPAFLFDRLGKKDNRHVQLKPVSKQTKEEAKQLAIDYLNREPEEAGVHLRFSLQTQDLSKKKIEGWAQAIVTACETVVPLRRIDWMKMEKNTPGQRLQRLVDIVHQAKNDPKMRFRRAIETVIERNEVAAGRGNKRSRSREPSPEPPKRRASGKLAPEESTCSRFLTPDSCTGP